MSKTILLNQNWIFSKEGHDEPVTLPHTWNAVDGQDGGNDYYRGTCCYTTVLPDIVLPENGRAVLQFDAVAMTAEVYLNEQKLAEHKGGYSAFCVDITDALRNGSNLLRVNVDNSDNDTVYPQKADFTFYGGIYRDVTLHVVPAAHFALAENGAVPVRVTPIVTDLDARRCEVTVEAAVVGAESVTFTLDGQQTNVAVKDGNARAVFTLEHARLWDGLDDPYLYTVTARLDNGETETARFGCRKFEIDPQKGFILNGRPYPLRGVSRHQDRKGAGVAITKEMMEEDMALILEMGANTIRLAHYQHAQAFYDLCDEKGIVIWAEIPYITMHMHNGRANTLTQMEELIVQNYNHPCIAVWGLSNEITAASAVNEELLENHRALNELAHRLDPTRPTTMANVFMLEITSPILEIPDVNSYNLYFGWYLGELDQNDDFFDTYHAKYPDRCIGFSEYGADANPAYQSAHPEKGDYTETYQCVYHEHMAKMIADRPWLWATHVWNMFDFGADGRDEGGKPGQAEPTGCPEGTTICVRDLFYNTPARMKFMKKDTAEGAAAAGVVTHLALSHPDVSFKLLRDGQEILHTPGDGQLLSAIYAALGRDFANSLLPVSGSGGAVRVDGFITKPLAGHGTRGRQLFFVNGRFIKSQLLTAALEEGYRNQLLKGRFPGCVLEVLLPVTAAVSIMSPPWPRPPSGAKSGRAMWPAPQSAPPTPT